MNKGGRQNFRLVFESHSKRQENFNDVLNKQKQKLKGIQWIKLDKILVKQAYKNVKPVSYPTTNWSKSCKKKKKKERERLVFEALHMEEQNIEIAFVNLQLGIQP